MRADWTPLFWEPVEGTGERLMAGVVMRLDEGAWSAHRLLRDDVLECLYGKAAADPRALIDKALKVCASIVEAAGPDALAQLPEALMGLHPGAPRTTDAISLGDALRQAVLLHASLAQLDGLDDEDSDAAPSGEDVNKRFATEVREAVLAIRPELTPHFGQSARLINGGKLVRFGFFSPRAVLHFSVLHPVRQTSSVYDARRKLWELSRAKAVSNVPHAALITAVPRDDDPTLGTRQRENLQSNRIEIEREADDVSMRLYPVVTTADASQKLLEVVG